MPAPSRSTAAGPRSRCAITTTILAVLGQIELHLDRRRGEPRRATALHGAHDAAVDGSNCGRLSGRRCSAPTGGPLARRVRRRHACGRHRGTVAVGRVLHRAASSPVAA